MRKNRGFRLGHRAVKLCKWVLKHKREQELVAGYMRLNPNPSGEKKMVTKICNWGLCLKQKFLRCSKRLSSDNYSRVGQIPFDTKPLAVPKGHLAVYVGQKDDGPHRVLVPLIYFNHPLFGELLREAEEEYGFDHSGGIKIPCRISDFETVQMRIANGEDCRKPVTWRRP